MASINLQDLIEIIDDQPTLRLDNGESGILRKIIITTDGIFVEISTDDGTGEYAIEEIDCMYLT
ncbi:MAG TPA: hypothetical protein VF692_13680 [Pyrinomonadaceae bacterium]|jgi:hypothetical protein